ncbi:hypothetical protein V8E52_003287 [Russula decolorans]
MRHPHNTVDLPYKYSSLSCVRHLESLITDYTDTINDPIARKIEGLLSSFSRQICLEQSRGMKETVITDYFHCP